MGLHSEAAAELTGFLRVVVGAHFVDPQGHRVVYLILHRGGKQTGCSTVNRQAPIQTAAAAGGGTVAGGGGVAASPAAASRAGGDHCFQEHQLPGRHPAGCNGCFPGCCTLIGKLPSPPLSPGDCARHRSRFLPVAGRPAPLQRPRRGWLRVSCLPSVKTASSALQACWSV